MTTHTDSILEALNTYTGDNIWDDLILALPTYEYIDEDYELRQQQTSDFFTAAGVEYRYVEQMHRWVAE